ncbi:response regulator [Hydrogenophaga sp.]|uniref:response regulator n=1 Tax=Hydrogenophaga sp. TaxID=1904254 RepID=UPI003F72C8DA
MNLLRHAFCPTCGMDPKLQLLLADDDRDSVDVLGALLGLVAAHFHVTFAFDGVQLLEAATADGAAYDAVLSDIDMPRMSGLTAAMRIRDALGPEAPLLIGMTGHAGTLRDSEMYVVFDHVLRKPFAIEELVELLPPA